MPPKRSKGDLPKICGNIEQLITIYVPENYPPYLPAMAQRVDIVYCVFWKFVCPGKTNMSGIEINSVKWILHSKSKAFLVGVVLSISNAVNEQQQQVQGDWVW